MAVTMALPAEPPREEQTEEGRKLLLDAQKQLMRRSD